MAERDRRHGVDPVEDDNEDFPKWAAKMRELIPGYVIPPLYSEED